MRLYKLTAKLQEAISKNGHYNYFLNSDSLVIDKAVIYAKISVYPHANSAIAQLIAKLVWGFTP